MQKNWRDQRVLQCGLRLGHFLADARFAKAFNDQPSLDDQVDPPAQCSVKPGNAERLRLLALLLRYIFKPEGINPPVSGIDRPRANARINARICRSATDVKRNLSAQ